MTFLVQVLAMWLLASAAAAGLMAALFVGAERTEQRVAAARRVLRPEVALPSPRPAADAAVLQHA
jgi:hypothetical protein